jgi:hypothetical protein
MAADRRNLPVLKTIVQGYGEALPHFPDYAIQALIWAGVVGATIGDGAQTAASALIAFLGVAFATTAFALAFVTIVDHHNEAVSNVFD